MIGFREVRDLVVFGRKLVERLVGPRAARVLAALVGGDVDLVRVGGGGGGAACAEGGGRDWGGGGG